MENENSKKIYHSEDQERKQLKASSLVTHLGFETA